MPMPVEPLPSLRLRRATNNRPRLPWPASLATLGLAASLLGAATLPAASAQDSAPPNNVDTSPITQAPPASFADLAQQVGPAVVNIAVTRKASARGRELPGSREHGFAPPPNHPFGEFFERHFGSPAPRDQTPGRDGVALGSGFVIDAEGHLVTNAHVIEGADEITVTFSDGTIRGASVIGADRRSDIALLKVESDGDLAAVSFGSSKDLRPGDWVVAVGNPFGLGGTVTAGIVSARGRDLRGGGLVDFLQIDAPINRGNSGGPSFNLAGEVIGINTAIFSPSGGSVGIGFAIPSDLAKTVIADLMDDGQVERGWLGVRIQPVTPDIAEGFGLEDDRGALVAAVESASPAEAAGLLPGDVILAWNGTPLERFKDLPRLVAATAAGHGVAIDLWRGGEPLRLEVTTGRLKENRHAALANQPSSDRQGSSEDQKVASLGLQLGTLDENQRESFDIEEGTAGVLVLAVRPGSAANQAGIRPGDVITSVALKPVEDPGQVGAIITENSAAGRQVLPLLVLRDDDHSFVTLRLADS